MNDLSPVTNLASNLKNLSTVGGTPVRLDCSSSSSSLAQCSFQSLGNDPPTVKYLASDVTSGENYKYKDSLRTPSRCFSEQNERNNLLDPKSKDSLHMPSWHCTEENKENNPLNFSSIAKMCNLSKHDSMDCADSDSSLKHCDLLPSITQFGEEDVLESLLNLDAGESKDIVSMPDMTSLLSKPLVAEKNNTRLSRKRLSIRRCLSMEMEHRVLETSEPDSSCPDPKCLSVERPSQAGATASYPTAQYKRRRSCPLQEIPENSLKRTFSETVMKAVQEAHLDPDLIGDCSKRFALPLTEGRHQDLKCISAQTLVHVMQGRFSCQVDKFTIVDCRYPYEFDAGHIQGAVNIFSKEKIEEVFLSEKQHPGRNIVIFHCEFSSERAPNLCRYLRNRDRKLNEKNYPKLFHPEIYLLDGGYKSFFEHFKRYCEPQAYKPMTHKDHGSELRYFRAKSKSWGADSKPRSRLKSASLSKTL